MDAESKKNLLQRISIRIFEEDDARILQPKALELIFHATTSKLCTDFKDAYQYWVIVLGTVLCLVIGIQWMLSIAIGLLLPQILSTAIYYYYDLTAVPKEAPDLQSPTKFSQRWLGTDKDVLYVASIDGHLVAMCGIAHRDSATCEIVRVMTIDGHQGKGIGSHLLKHVVKQCGQKGYKKIVLCTSNVQTDAHRLYRANHFVQTKMDGCGLCPLRFERSLDNH